LWGQPGEPVQDGFHLGFLLGQLLFKLGLRSFVEEPVKPFHGQPGLAASLVAGPVFTHAGEHVQPYPREAGTRRINRLQEGTGGFHARGRRGFPECFDLGRGLDQVIQNEGFEKIIFDPEVIAAGRGTFALPPVFSTEVARLKAVARIAGQARTTSGIS
jgi:hypothetical protein